VPAAAAIAPQWFSGFAGPLRALGAQGRCGYYTTNPMENRGVWGKKSICFCVLFCKTPLRDLKLN
jgi:hypothetical protein